MEIPVCRSYLPSCLLTFWWHLGGAHLGLVNCINLSRSHFRDGGSTPRQVALVCWVLGRKVFIGVCRVGVQWRWQKEIFYLHPQKNKTVYYYVKSSGQIIVCGQIIEFPELQIISPSPYSWGNRPWATQRSAWGDSLRARHLCFTPLNCVLCEELWFVLFSRLGPPSQVGWF